ncbi:TetR family transcriptional regulator [Rhodococcus koreensis]
MVEYLADRDERWRAFLAGHLDTVGDSPELRLTVIFDASREWTAENSAKGCSMVNAHAEISDPSHPAYAIIIGQKRWMLDLFTDVCRDASVRDPETLAHRRAAPRGRLGRTRAAGVPRCGATRVRTGCSPPRRGGRPEPRSLTTKSGGAEPQRDSAPPPSHMRVD